MTFSEHHDKDLGLFFQLPHNNGRIFVIGDIHGCHKELTIMLTKLANEVQKEDWIIFIGDYIDRGPGSCQVIDTLLEVKKQHANSLFLKGNHEAMLLEFIDQDRSMQNRFLKHGGKETFESYRLSPAQTFESENAGLPADHIHFVRNLTLGVQVSNFIITHAGINPLLPINQQTEKELLWIRDGFVDSPHPLPYTVVYGHTPVKEVELSLPYRIGIDTGLVYGNKLTCFELKEGVVHQIKLGSERVKSFAL